MFVVEFSLIKYKSCEIFNGYLVDSAHYFSDVEICRSLRSSLLLVCMTSLTLVAITMKGLTFQPCALLAFINALYLSSFVCMAWSRNLSCCEGELMIWMIRVSVGISKSFCLYVAPCMYVIPSFGSARHAPCVVLNMQLSIHGGMVLSWWLPC